PDATFPIPTPFTQRDMNLLNEYAQAGGALLVMGQDATSVMGSNSFLLSFTLGADRIRNSVTNNAPPSDPIIAYDGAPPAFNNIYLDLTGPNSALGRVLLTGLNERPVPVTNTGQITGVASFRFDNFTDELDYSV